MRLVTWAAWVALTTAVAVLGLVVTGDAHGDQLDLAIVYGVLLGTVMWAGRIIGARRRRRQQRARRVV